MKAKQIIKLILLLLSVEYSISSSCKCPPEDEDKLIYAQVIFRHGDRNIVKTYPNDPYGNEMDWPGGFGALTNIGCTQLYELGRFMRKRYANIIAPEYSSKDIYVYSTDTDRTLMSAQCNLAGLYPLSGTQQWNKHIRIQPVPIHTGPMYSDIYYPTSICPRWRHLLDNYLKSPELKLIMEEHRLLIGFLEEHSGQSSMSLQDVLFLYDTLYVQQLRGLVLPDWAQEAMKSNVTIQFLTSLVMTSSTHTTEMRKMRSGFILKDMLERFTNKYLNILQPDRSLWLISAHDISIINILNALGLWNIETALPPYGASLHFELYKSVHYHYVQIFYRTDYKKLEPLDIPNCGTKCSLDKFYRIYKDILPTVNIATACGLE